MPPTQFQILISQKLHFSTYTTQPAFNLSKRPITCNRRSMSKTAQPTQLRLLQKLQKCKCVVSPKHHQNKYFLEILNQNQFFVLKSLASFNNSKVIFKSQGIKRSKANSKEPKPALTKVGKGREGELNPFRWEGKWGGKHTAHHPRWETQDAAALGKDIHQHKPESRRDRGRLATSSRSESLACSKTAKK